MTEIYQRSAGTMIWLGNEGEDSDLAMRAISDFHTAWQSRSEELQEEFVVEEDESEYRRYVDNEMEPSNINERLLAIAKLFLRRWWD
jgi:hypothetical protein